MFELLKQYKFYAEGFETIEIEAYSLGSALRKIKEEKLYKEGDFEVDINVVEEEKKPSEITIDMNEISDEGKLILEAMALKKKKQDFYMLYVEGGNSPTYKHESWESARTEAYRLSILTGGQRVSLLRATSYIECKQTFYESSESEDLPF